MWRPKRLFPAVLLLICSLGARAQEKVIQHEPVKRTSPASGQEMFVNYCAVCHGKDGKGGGPAADALKVAPANLTVLSQKNGGKFPTNHVGSILRGDASLAAHGSQEMPVWGPIFWKMSQGNAGEVQQRIANLSKYIESLQVK
jgi:mono/diheme cytochrome c family protein